MARWDPAHVIRSQIAYIPSIQSATTFSFLAEVPLASPNTEWGVAIWTYSKYMGSWVSIQMFKHESDRSYGSFESPPALTNMFSLIYVTCWIIDTNLIN